MQSYKKNYRKRQIDKMTYYVVCPECGYKLLKAGDGSTIEIYCPKCKGKMQIAAKDGQVTVQKAPDNK